MSERSAIHTDRITPLNDGPCAAGRYVLYWMQASQRVRYNHALAYAIERANAHDVPVVVCFGLTDNYPEANERHYGFMLEGLRDVTVALAKKRIAFVMGYGEPVEVALRYAHDAVEAVCDRSYLRHQRRWRDEFADRVGRRLTQVESDVVVPVERASDKQESAARTLRSKYNRIRDEFLEPVRLPMVKRSAVRLRLAGDLDPSDPSAILKKIKIDRSVGLAPELRGGSVEATKRLALFIRQRLNGYDEQRNEPADAWHSWMSPYLHFGQVSPVEIALVAMKAPAPDADRDAYLEELLIRRELAINFCHYCPHYDSYDAIPDWARRTLAKHATDHRPVRYTERQLEKADTHDRYWNAAQKQMMLTGFIHNYMRMYWGKKILEWSDSPEMAWRTTLRLNNKWFIDGRDPNSYANVGWLFGLHDRPWQERAIFGTVRYMNDKGLERKFDIDRYVRQVDQLEQQLNP